jgi:hypothetical protein
MPRMLGQGSRLSLTPKTVQEPEPAETPVYDPEALAVQTYGAEGAGFIQGKNFFTANGKFIREVPKEQWYITTPEQEANNRKARAKQRAMFAGKGVAVRARPAIPEKLLDASRENARAFAAETLAE